MQLKNLMGLDIEKEKNLMLWFDYVLFYSIYYKFKQLLNKFSRNCRSAKFKIYIQLIFMCKHRFKKYALWQIKSIFYILQSFLLVVLYYIVNSLSENKRKKNNKIRETIIKWI